MDTETTDMMGDKNKDEGRTWKIKYAAVLSSASLVLKGFFSSLFITAQFFFPLKPSPASGSAWMARNWKWQPRKAWDWIHTIFQNAITRLLTSCVAPMNGLCGIVHKLENVQLGPSFSSGEERCIIVAEGRKTQNRLRSPRPPKGTPHYHTVLGVGLRTRSKVLKFYRNIEIQTSEVAEKHQVHAQIYISFYKPVQECINM